MRLLLLCLLLIFLRVEALVTYGRRQLQWEYRSVVFNVTKQNDVISQDLDYMKLHINDYRLDTVFTVNPFLKLHYPIYHANQYLRFSWEEFPTIAEEQEATVSWIEPVGRSFGQGLWVIYLRNDLEVARAQMDPTSKVVTTPQTDYGIIDFDSVVLILSPPNQPPDPEPYRINGRSVRGNSDKQDYLKDEINSASVSSPNVSPSLARIFSLTGSKRRHANSMNSVHNRLSSFETASSSLSQPQVNVEDDTDDEIQVVNEQPQQTLTLFLSKAIRWPEKNTAEDNEPLYGTQLNLYEVLNKEWKICGPEKKSIKALKTRPSPWNRRSLKKSAFPVVSLGPLKEKGVSWRTDAQLLRGYPHRYMIHSYGLPNFSQWSQVSFQQRDADFTDQVQPRGVFFHNIEAFRVSETGRRKGFRLHVKWILKTETSKPNFMFTKEEQRAKFALVVFDESPEINAPINQIYRSTKLMWWGENLALDLPPLSTPVRFATLFVGFKKYFFKKLLQYYDLHAWEEPLCSRFTYHKEDYSTLTK